MLLDELINANKLTDVALLVGSEAARGVPKLRMKRPSFATSSVEQFASVIDGSYFTDTKFSPALAYGQAKYLGALWMPALARVTPSAVRALGVRRPLPPAFMITASTGAFNAETAARNDFRSVMSTMTTSKIALPVAASRSVRAAWALPSLRQARSTLAVSSRNASWAPTPRQHADRTPAQTHSGGSLVECDRRIRRRIRRRENDHDGTAPCLPRRNSTLSSSLLAEIPLHME